MNEIQERMEKLRLLKEQVNLLKEKNKLLKEQNNILKALIKMHGGDESEREEKDNDPGNE